MNNILLLNSNKNINHSSSDSKTDKKLVIIQTTGYLLSISHSMEVLLQSDDTDVRIMDANTIENDIYNHKSYTKNAIFIMLFIWHFKRPIQSHITYYIYNLEQIHRYPDFPCIPVNSNKTLIEQLFKKSKGILDYSLTNISMYPHIYKKIITYYPIPFLNFTNVSMAEKKIKILFFGALTHRRRKILEELQKNLSFQITVITGNQQVYGVQLYSLICQSTIVLNIHADKDSLLETGRIHDCLCVNHGNIISEEPSVIDKDIMSEYNDVVHFVPIIDDDLSNLDTIITLIDKINVDDTKKIVNINKLRYNIKKRVSFINGLLINNNLNSIIDYENKYNISYMLPKDIHRYNCLNYIELIRNIKIKNFGSDKLKETVLIEFRNFPHIEFLLRNTINKLSSEWNHTVLCGTNNFQLVRKICNAICKKLPCRIKIINLNISNLTPSEYSELLLTKDFWNHFHGEKLLVYQEDTQLFHGNIDLFLKYDYVGAPWPENQDDNSLGVGNGGFSLRSKSKMIECIENVKMEDLEIGTSTKEYMKNTNSTFLPEDVFFSKSLIDFKLGNVCSRDIARTFSQETQLSLNPLGGHNFWIADCNALSKPYIYRYRLLSDYHINTNHRSGWKNLIQNCLSKNIITQDFNEIDIGLIDSMEDYFLYSNNPSIITPWIGIIHFTNELPHFLDKQSIGPLYAACKHSLPTCKAIIALSKYSENQIKQIFPSISTYCIKHPIEKLNKKFKIDAFLNNEKHSIIQLGLQYRKVSTIYTIKAPNKKIWLPGIKNKNLCIDIVNIELSMIGYDKNNGFNNVIIKRTANNSEYDHLLLNNIIIIPLWNASANNSVLECMEMNIPAFVSRLPSTAEYLGDNYPMFYSDITEVEEIINNKVLFKEKYKETYSYLRNINNNDIRYEHFNSELLKIINCSSLLYSNTNIVIPGQKYKKILIITLYPLIHGGGEKYLYDIINFFGYHHFRTTLISPSSDKMFHYISQQLLDPYILKYNLIEHYNKSTHNLNTLQSHKYDFFLYMSNSKDNPIKKRIATIQWFHCQFPCNHLKVWSNVATQNTVDRIIVNSEYTYDEYVSSLKKHNEKCHVPINILHPLCFNTESNKSFIKKTNTFVCLGRIFTPTSSANNKMFDKIIHVFNRILKTSSVNSTLHIIGTVKDDTWLSYLLKLSAHNKHIIIHPNASDTEKQNLLKSSEFYIHGAGLGIDKQQFPEQFEHFGISIIESMHYGCIPICVNGGYPEYYINHKENGYLFHDEQQLYDIIITILNGDRIYMNKAREENYILIRKFSKEKHNKTLLKLLTK